MNAQLISRYTAAYAAVASTLPGQSLAWLQQWRQKAISLFNASGFPSLRDEEWRYTNLAGLEKKAFTPVATGVSEDQSWTRFVLPDAWVAVLIDGHFSAEQSRLQDLPAGVTVLSMADALQQQPEVVQQYLGSAVKHTEHNLVAFNSAWFSDGVWVHVPKNQVLTKPIQILQVVTAPDSLVATRNVVALDSWANAVLVETFVGIEQAPAYLSATVTEVCLADEAELTTYKLQAEASKAYHFSGTYVQQGKAARFSQQQFAFGALIARTDSHVDLQQAAECSLHGLYSGIDRQHLDNHTRISHNQPHGISREMYKGILDGKARGVFQGRVVVAEQAQKTDSQMQNRNLLLSSDAEADTKPQLEIYADDVKCSHGVTVGQLDDKSIFYLQSRGVDVESARNMLTFAFANEMVAQIKLASLHAVVLELLLQRFPQADVEKDWL